MNDRIEKILDKLEVAVKEIERDTILELEKEVVYKDDIFLDISMGKWPDGSGHKTGMLTVETMTETVLIKKDLIQLIRETCSWSEGTKTDVKYLKKLVKFINSMIKERENEKL